MRLRPPPRAPTRGFTLVEVMLVTTIFAIVVAAALPSFNAIVVRNRLSTQANALVSDLAYARSEAVRRSATVSVCASVDGVTCASATDWGSGRIVFFDAVGDGVFNANDLLLRTYRATSGDALTNAPARSGVTFQRDGTLLALTTFTVCHSGYTGYQVSLMNIGRPRLVPTTAPC